MSGPADFQVHAYLVTGGGFPPALRKTEDAAEDERVFRKREAQVHPLASELSLRVLRDALLAIEAGAADPKAIASAALGHQWVTKELAS